LQVRHVVNGDDSQVCPVPLDHRPQS